MPHNGPESTFVRSSFHLYSHIISKGDDCGEKKQIPTGHCRKAPQVQEVSERFFAVTVFQKGRDTGNDDGKKCLLKKYTNVLKITPWLLRYVRTYPVVPDREYTILGSRTMSAV